MKPKLGLIGTLTLAAITGCATTGTYQEAAEKIYERGPVGEQVLLSPDSCAYIESWYSFKFDGDPKDEDLQRANIRIAYIDLSVCSYGRRESDDHEFRKWRAVRGSLERRIGSIWKTEKPENKEWKIEAYDYGHGCLCYLDGTLETDGYVTPWEPHVSGKQKDLFRVRLEEADRALRKK